jgi:hypothetical protein
VQCSFCGPDKWTIIVPCSACARYYLFSRAFRLAVGLNRPLVKLVLKVLSGVERSGREAGHVRYSAEVKNERAIVHSAIVCMGRIVTALPSPLQFKGQSNSSEFTCIRLLNLFLWSSERRVFFYVHGSLHRNINLTERTNKMQPCSGIDYSDVS